MTGICSKEGAAAQINLKFVAMCKEEQYGNVQRTIGGCICVKRLHASLICYSEYETMSRKTHLFFS